MPAAARPMISIGDLMVAVKTLGADGPTTRTIADLLGLLPAATAPDAGRLQPARDADAARRPADTLQARPIRNEAPESRPRRPALSREILSSDLVPVEGERFDGFDSEPLPIQDAAPALARLEHEPLFVPGWSRAILSAALATAARTARSISMPLSRGIATKRRSGDYPACRLRPCATASSCCSTGDRR